MAYGVLPKPGEKFGPCLEDCKHTDCQATRKDASILCEHCGLPIGYGRAFVRNDQGLPVHLSCEQEAIDQERQETPKMVLQEGDRAKTPVGWGKVVKLTDKKVTVKMDKNGQKKTFARVRITTFYRMGVSG